MEPKLKRVRLEYDDGSSREVIGEVDCAEWLKLSNAHASLWMSRGWPDPGKFTWHEFKVPVSDKSP